MSIKNKVSTGMSCRTYVREEIRESGLLTATHSDCLSILPCLYEVMFLGVDAVTLETAGKVVVPPLS